MSRLASRHSLRVRATALVAAGAFAVSALAACFSEHDAPTEPIAAGECRIPLDERTIGATIVFIREFAFHPQTITVPAGGRVAWVNCDEPGTEPHTSTSDGPTWDSGLLSPGMIYSRSFDAAGSFPYHCEPHPGMTGTVTVE
jgi:plastocyanin